MAPGRGPLSSSFFLFPSWAEGIEEYTDKGTDRLSTLDHDARISTCRVTWMLLEKLEQIQVGIVALRVNEPSPGGQEARKSKQED